MGKCKIQDRVKTLVQRSEHRRSVCSWERGTQCISPNVLSPLHGSQTCTCPYLVRDARVHSLRARELALDQEHSLAATYTAIANYFSDFMILV